MRKTGKRYLQYRSLFGGAKRRLKKEVEAFLKDKNLTPADLKQARDFIVKLFRNSDDPINNHLPTAFQSWKEMTAEA